MDSWHAVSQPDFLLLSEASDTWRALWPPQPWRRVCEVCTRQLLSPGNAHQPVYSAPHHEMNHIFVLMCSAADLAQWVPLSHPGTVWRPDQLHKMSRVYCSVPPAFASPLVLCRVARFTIFISLLLLFTSPSLSVWQISMRYLQHVSHLVCPQAVFILTNTTKHRDIVLDLRYLLQTSE